MERWAEPRADPRAKPSLEMEVRAAAAAAAAALYYTVWECVVVSCWSCEKIENG